MPKVHSRRRFLRQSAAIAAGACTSLACTGDVIGNSGSRLKVGIVGVDETGGQLVRVVQECDAELVAHCGADSRAAQDLAALHPGAAHHGDFQSMIDRASLDAVIVPHGVANSAEIARHALQRGCHVYSGPVGESIVESRELAGLAQQSRLLTEVNLRFAGDQRLRHIVEPLQAGAIGPIREVVCWSNGVSHRSFQTQGHCVLSLPMSALALEHPSSIFASGSISPGPEYPQGMGIRYEFPQIGERPPVRVTWYDGDWAPPYESVDGIELSACGALYLGESGQILDDQGTGRAALLLEGQAPQELNAIAAPSYQTLRSWLAACAGSSQALNGFERASTLNETILAGLIAYRVQQPLEWDGPAMRARNCPRADALTRTTIDAIGSV